MKYVFNTLDSSVTRHESTLPPLGMLVPAGQTIRVTLTSPITLGSWFTSSDPLPGGFEVRTSTETYGIDHGFEPGAWVDYTFFQRAEAVVLSGQVYLTNPANYDVGITWR